MDYTEDELLKIYNEARKGILSNNELKDIEVPLKLICQVMTFDSYALDDIINTLFYFK